MYYFLVSIKKLKYEDTFVQLFFLFVRKLSSTWKQGNK
jgi:hypothetical protein